MSKQAALEVIQAKRDYTGGETTESVIRAAEARKRAGLDDSRYGADVSLADSLTYFMEDFGNVDEFKGNNAPREESSDRRSPYEGYGDRMNSPYQQQDSGRSYDEIESFYRDSADSHYESQRAQLDSALQEQLQNLEMAYQEAVQNGEMSVRDAQRDFEAQKKEIEQSAYQQSQATKAYGNQMGIGHSQQMVGLQQGDSARVNEINNANATGRDQRIADIKSRLNMIKNQKNIQETGAKAQHGYALAGARSQSDQMYNQSMGAFAQQDYFNQQQMSHAEQMQWNEFGHGDYMFDRETDRSDRQRGEDRDFQFDMEDFRNTNAIGMALMQQGFNIENLNTQQLHALEKMEVENSYIIDRMDIQHDHNLEQLKEQIAGSLLEIDRRAGYTAAENAKDRRATASNIAAQIKAQVDANNAEFDRTYKSMFDPDSKEYAIREQQKNEANDDYMRQILGGTFAEYTASQVFEGLSYEGTAPKDYRSSPGKSDGGYMPVGHDMRPTQGGSDGFGVMMNKFTGYDTKTKKYEEGMKNKTEAQRKLDAIMGKIGLNFGGN